MTICSAGSTPRWPSRLVEDLHDWPGERFGHRSLLEVRGGSAATFALDAMCVALAEALDAPLLILDERLARVRGLVCPVEVVDRSG